MQDLGNFGDLFSHRMPMGIAVFDGDLVLRRCNPTWVRYVEVLAAPLDEVKPGLSLLELLRDAVPPILPLVQQALSGETAVADALPLPGQDTIFYWNVALMPVHTDDVVTGFSLVATDVTDQVLTRQLLERHVADRTRKLSALYDVMAVAAEPLGLKEILHNSLVRVLTAVQAQAGMIQLLDSSSTHLSLAVHQNLPPSIVTDLQTVPADNELTGQLVQHWAPLVLRDLERAAQTPALLRNSGLHAYAGLQMNAKGRVVGVFSVFRERKRPFSQEDIALLDSVADQIGGVVENARLRKQNEQLLVLEERNRLARELHDAVTQSLYSLTLFAEANYRFARSGNLDRAAEYAHRSGETAQQALREMRLLVHNLRPSILEQAGLARALQQRLDGVERRARVDARLHINGELDLPPHVEEALYHIAQEALNNALKHAGATAVTVSLSRQGDDLRLSIQDNGRGFDPDALADSGGLGLVSMRERVELLQGKLTINAAVGCGTTISVFLNLRQVGEPAHDFDTFDLL